MSEQAGDIVVKLSADQAKFDADLKQAKERLRNFGNQSKETEQQVEGLGKRLETAADYGKLFTMSLQDGVATLTGAATGVIGFAAGLSVYVSSAAEHGRELQEYASKAGVTVEQIQALSYATEQYNVSGDKMADILKDTREKLGEYAATGGGGFKDFFDNIGKKVGLTAAELQKLSGPDVLVAVKNAMDATNVSAQEQTFYLEGIASDLSLLNPLLENNGQRLKDLTGHYNSLNSALSATDIANLQAMDQKFKDISITMQGAFAHGVVGAGQQIDWFTDKLSTAVRYWGTLFDSWSDNPKTEDALVKKLGEKREEIADLKQQMDDIKGKYQPGEEMLRWDQGAVDALNQQIKEQEAVLDDLQKNYEKIRFGMHGGLPSDNPPPAVVVPPSSGNWQQAKTPKEKKTKEPNYAAVDSFRDETTAIGQELEKRKALLQNSQQAMSAMEQQYRDQRAVDIQTQYGAEIIEEQNRYTKQQQALQEKYASAYDAAATNHDLQFALQQERYAALENLKQDHETRLLQAEVDRVGKQRAYQQQVAQELLSYTEQTMSITTSAMQNAGMEHTAVYKALFLAQKAAAIPAMVVSTEEAAAKALAAFPPPYSIGLSNAVRTMGYASIGIVAGQAIAGMAHDGIDNIPKEGTWLLDQGERVVDSRTNSDLKDYLASRGRGGFTVYQTLNVTGNGDTALYNAMLQAAEIGAQKAYSAVGSDFKTNGPLRRSLS